MIKQGLNHETADTLACLGLMSHLNGPLEGQGGGFALLTPGTAWNVLFRSVLFCSVLFELTRCVWCRWREERKKQYPSTATLEQKAAQKAARAARGELDPAAETGRLRLREVCPLTLFWAQSLQSTLSCP